MRCVYRPTWLRTDRKVVGAEQPLDPRLRQNRAQQLGDNVAFSSRSRFLENVE